MVSLTGALASTGIATVGTPHAGLTTGRRQVSPDAVLGRRRRGQCRSPTRSGGAPRRSLAARHRDRLGSGERGVQIPEPPDRQSPRGRPPDGCPGRPWCRWSASLSSSAPAARRQEQRGGGGRAADDGRARKAGRIGGQLRPRRGPTWPVHHRGSSNWNRSSGRSSLVRPDPMTLIGPRKRRLAGLLVLVAVALAGVVALGASVMDRGGDDTAAPPATIDPAFVKVRDDICAAVARARSGDAPGAGSVFRGRVHQPLHQLAAATQARDRAVAARLLEAKAGVETSLDPPQPTLADDLDELALAAGRAISSLGGNDSGACAQR